MNNYTYYECPIAYYCDAGSEPTICPPGTSRNHTGAASELDCYPCADGFYCPNNTENARGIPCEETYECPEVRNGMETDNDLIYYSLCIIYV